MQREILEAIQLLTRYGYKYRQIPKWLKYARYSVLDVIIMIGIIFWIWLIKELT